jgi:CheY-like chemotaxis protein
VSDDSRLVIVVEDDGSMQRVLSRVLKWRGYTPLVFAEMTPALAAIIERRPIAVTLDYDLGEKTTGAELARAIANALGDDAPPLILVSALADRLPPAERELFAAIHTKPFRALALLDDLDRCIGPASKRSGVRALTDKIAQRRARGE